MASIRKINGKNGVSFKITVSMGRDAMDNQIRHYKTWKPDKAMTAKQAEREAKRIAYEFERDLLLGFQADNRQTFKQYAEYVNTLREQRGDKPQTMARVRRQLVRINEHIGDMKLSDIKPQHLTTMYKKLGEPGTNHWMRFAAPAVDFRALVGSCTHEQFGEKCGVYGRLITRLCNNQYISLKNAETIEKNLCRKDLFMIVGSDDALSPQTIRAMHGVVSVVLGQAVKEMILQYNPAERATLPRKNTVRNTDAMQPETVAAMVEKLKKEPIELQSMLTLFLVTGCRRGELLALKWKNVLFDKRQIVIDSSVGYLPGCGVFEGSTKTNKIRTVPLPADAIALLRHHRAKQNEWRLSVGDLWQDHDYVFARHDGTAINPTTVNLMLDDFCKRHGLPHINPHKFRHTVASVLLTNGIDVLTVSKLLGHSDTSTTTDIYGHAIDEAKAKAAECVSEIILKQKKA